MKTELLKVLDECIARIGQGESIETCLAEYPKLREQIEPLLHTALSIIDIPKVSPSDDFRRESKARLIARLRQESSQTEVATPNQRMPLSDALSMAWQGLCQRMTGARRLAIPATIVIVFTLLTSLYQIGPFSFLSPTPVSASQTTLRILSGNVEIQMPDELNWQSGTDAMILPVGSRVRTTSDSHAIFTFSEGSTIKLLPDTEVGIENIEHDGELATIIILEQSGGTTWSSVTEKAGEDSHYQVLTPTASVVVHGTLFTTEVNETGSTTVTTTEGLVSVIAQEEEVQLPPGQQTGVEAGAPPSQPLAISGPKSELIIDNDMLVFSSVIDPTGSSTGNLPDGLTFNQILGSQYSLSNGASQFIKIREPISGEYLIVLRYVDEGISDLEILGKSGGEVVFEYSDAFEGSPEEGWLIHLNLNVEDGQIINGTITGTEPILTDAPNPEKIVDIRPSHDKGTDDKGKGS
ncbi:FecR domain-containing protein, partial [Chloroflexota bacterium]